MSHDESSAPRGVDSDAPPNAENVQQQSESTPNQIVSLVPQDGGDARADPHVRSHGSSDVPDSALDPRENSELARTPTPPAAKPPKRKDTLAHGDMFDNNDSRTSPGAGAGGGAAEEHEGGRGTPQNDGCTSSPGGAPIPELRPSPSPTQNSLYFADRSPGGVGARLEAQPPPPPSSRVEIQSSSNLPTTTLDLQIGTWRDSWPKDITCVIAVDENLLVRYVRGLRKLELVECIPQNSAAVKHQPQPQDGSAADEDLPAWAFHVCDSFWMSSLPQIGSIHHFTVPEKQFRAAVQSSNSGGSSGIGGGMGASRSGTTGDAATVQPTLRVTESGSLDAAPPVEKERNCLLCVAEDAKRCIIFGVAAGKTLAQIGVTSLPMKATHVVPFVYRGISYFLTYYQATGEYGIIPFATIVGRGATPQLVAKGQFRAGWTDVVWKGTHHVRCTRQKFFCYNHLTGETVFECVWIRGMSATSSVCSAEHVTMDAARQASTPGALADPDLITALKRKSCIVVPMCVGGRFAALLYTHSAMDDSSNRKGAGGRRGSLLAQRTTSTGRLLDSVKLSPDAIPVRSQTLVNVANAASLLLQKRVFAHSEPWTHFCLLSDFIHAPPHGDPRDASGNSATLLCYSSASGDVWINTLYVSDAAGVQHEVTLIEGQSPKHPRHEKSAKRAQRPTGGQGTGGADDANSVSTLNQFALTARHHKSGGPGSHLNVDVGRFAQEQASRKSPFDAPVESGRQSPAAPSSARYHGRPPPHPPQLDGDSRAGYHHHHEGAAAGEFAFVSNSRASARAPSGGTQRSSPNSGRRSSCSVSLSERLRQLPPPTGNYRQDIAAVIEHLAHIDFEEHVPYPKLALDNIRALPPVDPKLVALERSRGTPHSNNSDGERAGSRHSGVGEATLRVDGGIPLQLGKRVPWRPASAPDVKIPAPPNGNFVKFERAYAEHREESPRKADPKVLEHLTRPTEAKETWQQKQLEAMDRAIGRCQVGHNADPKHVAETVHKLSVADVEIRKKREADRLAQRDVRQQASLHARPLSMETIGASVDRLHQHDVDTRANHLKALKEKLYRECPIGVLHLTTAAAGDSGKSGPSATSPLRLTAAQQRAVNDRLDRESVQRKRATVERIAREMDEEVRRHAYETLDPTHTMQRREVPVLGEDEWRELSNRLYHGEARHSPVKT